MIFLGLLQLVMFGLYGNHYEDREEFHLLSMFEVSHKFFASPFYPSAPPYVQLVLLNVH